MSQAERDRILSWHHRIGPEEPDSPVWWTIAERGLGATVGHTRCGTHDPAATGGRIRAEALTVGDIIRVPVPDGGFLQDRITAITQSAAGAPIVVDLAPVANSRVRRVVEFAADEAVDVVRRSEERSV
jgi:cell wall assembly regulator SMI1